LVDVPAALRVMGELSAREIAKSNAGCGSFVIDRHHARPKNSPIRGIFSIQHPFPELLMSGVPKPAGSLLQSTLALKVYMALTGVMLSGFLLIHMVGHLQVFASREAYNTYAEMLQNLGMLKWLARLGLLGALVVHVACAINLNARKHAARPNGYPGGLRRTTTSVAAMYMFEGGLVVFAFVLYHLAHFTLGFVHTEGFDLVDGDRRDLFSHFVMSFQHPIVVATYILANGALAAHLSHGVSSLFKTLGLAQGRFRAPIEAIGPAFAVLIFLGFISVPVACFLGLVTLGGH
jgi:succinate dehydrogenase / fumarate reductase cytochrome b subunit